MIIVSMWLYWSLFIALAVGIMMSQSILVQGVEVEDRSWIGAYNAAWVRVKASGTFPAVLEAAYPGLPSLRFL